MLTILPNKLQETIDEQHERERRERVQGYIITTLLIISTLLIIGAVGYLMGVNV